MSIINETMTAGEWRKSDHQSEADFTTQVVELASLRGWLVTHSRPAMTAKGYRTAIQGHKGFPDVVACRGGRLVVAELKSESGRFFAEQVAWLGRLDEVRGIEVYRWRPRDWAVIEGVLL